MTAFFFKLELLYDELKLSYEHRISREKSKQILGEMAPFIARTPSIATNMYQSTRLEELLRVRTSIVDTAVTDFKKPWFDLEGKGLIDFETHPTTPYELRIVTMMLKRPHTIEYFRANLQEEWFKDANCRIMFNFLCDKTRKDRFDYTYRSPGDEAPLLENAFKQNIPKEISQYAASKCLGTKEFEINILYKYMKNLPINFGSDQLRLLLEESYLEYQLVEFEDKNLSEGRVVVPAFGILSPYEAHTSESEIHSEYLTLFRQFMDVQTKFTDRLRRDYEKLERRRWAREQRAIEKEKNAQQRTLFDLPPEEEKEDPNGRLF